MKYRLAPLLKIREKRRDEAEERVALARSALEQREKELSDRKRELANYIDWCDKEATRLFTSVAEKAVAHHEIMAIREQIAWNRGRTVTFQQKVTDATAAVEAAKKEAEAAQKALEEAARQLWKIQEHQAHWMRAQQALNDAAEEDAMEESATAGFLRSRKAA